MAQSVDIDHPAQDVALAREDSRLHILLAVSGSVATIKLPQMIKGLARLPSISIRLVFTNAAMHFLQGQADEQPSLAEIRQLPNVDAIYTDESEWAQPWIRGTPILHIELRKWADVMVVAPLSANTMAKIVAGMADDLLTSIILAWDTDGSVDGVKKKIVLAPAMNTAMFRNPLTRRNLRMLEEQMGGENGWVEVLLPVSKTLACGDVGEGAMVSWETIVAVTKDKLKLGLKDNGDAPTTS